MTKKEIAARNIGLTFDFVRQMVDNPDSVESIPGGAELSFIGTDVPMSPLVKIKVKTAAKYMVGHVFERVKG